MLKLPSEFEVTIILMWLSMVSVGHRFAQSAILLNLLFLLARKFPLSHVLHLTITL
jgi:hypothetical protein